MKDFWRGDIAGLYTVKEARLIELSVAGADDRPVTDIELYCQRSTKAGHWFRALRFADEKIPDPRRWAACAFPDGPTAGRRTFIISHEGAMYSRQGIFRDLEVFPTAAELARDWTRMH